MILSAKSIREVIASHPGMIKPTPDRSFIEGGLLNLHLHKIQKQKKVEHLCFTPGIFAPNPQPIVVIGKEIRSIPEGVDCKTFCDDDKEWYWCEPGVPYLLQTVETVCLPPGIEAKVCTRTSMFRGGGSMDREWVPYGFNGQLTVQFAIPEKGLPHKIEKGAPVIALKFFWVDNGHILDPEVFDATVNSRDNLDGYRGLWKKGKMTTKGKEERGT